MDPLYTKIQETDGFLAFMQSPTSIFTVTDERVFGYFGLDKSAPMLKDKMFAANAQLVYRTKFTYTHVTKWLFLCALDVACIAPINAQLRCSFNVTDRSNYYANCHRYDQSVVNTLYAIAMQDKHVGFVQPHFARARRENEKKTPQQSFDLIREMCETIQLKKLC